MNIQVGDRVKWTSGRNPLGVVILLFKRRGQDFVVVENETTWRLIVVRVYDKLVKA